MCFAGPHFIVLIIKDSLIWHSPLADWTETILPHCISGIWIGEPRALNKCPAPHKIRCFKQKANRLCCVIIRQKKLGLWRVKNHGIFPTRA